jgi:hypothetical protein
MAESFRGKTLGMILLEVVLISAGVFLGLLGEQWRERASERELATIALRRLRTEIAADRKAVADAQPYHARLRNDLRTYFTSPDGGKSFDEKVKTNPGDLRPVFFQRTAWDMTQATGAMAHIDPDLAFALSSAYALQQDYAALQAAILQGTIYGRSWRQDFDGYWQSISSFMGDVSVFDRMLLKAYDNVLPMIDNALAE